MNMVFELGDITTASERIEENVTEAKLELEGDNGQVPIQRFVAIMAGGSGERFWPLSRRVRPKQLLRLNGATTTMLEDAVNRQSPLIPREQVLIAAAAHLREPMLHALDDFTAERILTEPAKRNTAGCVVWTAANLLAKGIKPEEVMLAMVPADHRIVNEDGYQRTLQTALHIAETTDALVTIGIPTTRPETGYGYIEANFAQPISGGAARAFPVTKFHEKPSEALASNYVTQEEFYWNAGMFFWRLSSLLSELNHTSPKHHDALLEIAQYLASGEEQQAEELFCTLPDISIDYALMEGAKNVAMVEAAFEWDDLGSWDALDRYMVKDARGNSFVGDAILLHSADCMVHNESKNMTVCVLGGYDLMVITTDDAVLVCNRDQAQSVRAVVDELKRRGSEKI